MDRSKKSEKNSVKKKNGAHDDMEAEIPKKKLPAKKKDKNWKNHLLDNDEEDDDMDMSSLEGLDGFESHSEDFDDDDDL